jgi:hypothetical protein
MPRGSAGIPDLDQPVHTRSLEIRGIAHASTEVDRQSELVNIAKLRLRDDQMVLMRDHIPYLPKRKAEG